MWPSSDASFHNHSKMKETCMRSCLNVAIFPCKFLLTMMVETPDKMFFDDTWKLQENWLERHAKFVKGKGTRMILIFGHLEELGVSSNLVYENVGAEVASDHDSPNHDVGKLS